MNTLLKINAKTARDKALYRTDKERQAAALMKNPLDFKKAYSYLGLLLGTFPPLTIFAKWAYVTGITPRDEFWIFGILFLVNLTTAVTGYFTGKLLGKSFAEAESLSWTKMLLTVPFIGLLWGVMAGGAGGVFIFVVGAFFGALLGGIVGAVTAPFFTILHRLLKQGEMIELKHFLPISFGIIFSICSFILGL